MNYLNIFLSTDPIIVALNLLEIFCLGAAGGFFLAMLYEYLIHKGN